MSAAGDRGESGVRVKLPTHLRVLARVDGEVRVRPGGGDAGADGAVTTAALLDALEAQYPVLRGAIREHGTLRRRAFVRFFACGEDLSHRPPDEPLPDAVARGDEPFLVVGAMAGG